jgi:hypothetical protein
MVPQLRIVGEVKGRICDTRVLRGALHSKVVFAPVEPRHGVTHVVVFRELHLVRGGESVILFVIMVADARFLGRARREGGQRS